MTINDKPIIDLAKFIAKYQKNLTDDTTHKAAAKALKKWESFQSIDYLDGLDLDTPEKCIHTLLQMLVYAPSCQRQSIYRLISSNLQDYADICQHCPSGLFSKTLLNDVVVTIDYSK
jgi:hypothetical protein